MKAIRRAIAGNGALTHRDFRRLCVAQVFGGLGEWLATLALIALVWERTHSALASGVILSFRILPAALVGSFLGSLVDRLDRRQVLVVCTAGRACVYGALPFVGGVAPVLALALVAEVASITFIAARDATVPRMVPKAALPTANALSMATGYGAMPVGSGLFALLTWAQTRAGHPGVGLSLVAAAVTLGVATLLVGRVRASACSGVDEKTGSPEERGGSLRVLKEIFRSDPLLRRIAIGGIVASSAGGAILTLGIAYVRGTLGAGPAAYSGLLTSFCFGAALGVIAVQRGRRHLPAVFRAGVGAMGAILLGMALFPSQAVGYGMGFVFGGAFVASFLGGITILQERVHDSVRGRAFALAHSSLRIGAVAVGVLAAWGAKTLGTTPRAVVGLSLDGTQVMLAATGVALAAAAVFIIRRPAGSIVT